MLKKLSQNPHTYVFISKDYSINLSALSTHNLYKYNMYCNVTKYYAASKLGALVVP